MMATPLTVVGVYRVVPSQKQVDETIELQYGSDLTPDERGKAQASVRNHFARLYLIEVSGEGLGEEFRWDEVTQEQPGVPRVDWQAVYDEQPSPAPSSNWIFYFHELDVGRPLLTPLGPTALPAPTDMPVHLRHLVYEAP